MTGRHKAASGAPPTRRTFLRGVAAGGALALGGVGWWALADEDSPQRIGLGSPSAKRGILPVGPYGVLAPPDANGLRLPVGFSSRILARSSRKVAGTDYVWHPAPDGGACFSDGEEWIYVSNSEMSDGEGGVGALRFGADGNVKAAYRILDGTNRNCAGGATPWGTWLSCEETSRGLVYETYPLGDRPAVVRPAMGAFRHEAAAVDPVRRCVYLTEDQKDGCFYRFVPDSYPDLGAGRLEVLCGEGPIRWEQVPDPSAKRKSTRTQVRAARHFDGGEGAVFGDGSVWFTTKGDGKVWRLHAPTQTLEVVYSEETRGAPISGLDNITRTGLGELFIAEDKGTLDIGLISPNGQVSAFAHLEGHLKSEIAGPSFSPDGKRLYFSSQRGQTNEHSDGYTFEIAGPFHHLNSRDLFSFADLPG